MLQQRCQSLLKADPVVLSSSGPDVTDDGWQERTFQLLFINVFPQFLSPVRSDLTTWWKEVTQLLGSKHAQKQHILACGFCPALVVCWFCLVLRLHFFYFLLFLLFVANIKRVSVTKWAIFKSLFYIEESFDGNPVLAATSSQSFSIRHGMYRNANANTCKFAHMASHHFKLFLSW